MDGRALARLAAIVVVAVAGTAAAIYVARDSEPPVLAGVSGSVPEAPTTDPLHTTLQRCLALGELATYDHDCLAAWAEDRRRFLTPGEAN